LKWISNAIGIGHNKNKRRDKDKIYFQINYRYNVTYTLFVFVNVMLLMRSRWILCLDSPISAHLRVGEWRRKILDNPGCSVKKSKESKLTPNAIIQ